MKRKILVVDDEKIIVKGLKYSFEQDDIEVDVAYDGLEALDKIKNNAYSVILLDIMLPGMTGTEVCQAVREFSDVPIVMLTAKSEDMDKILGFENGADDYITKPFNMLEVKARIKAIIRRNEGLNKKRGSNMSLIRTGDIVLDKDNRRLYIKDEEINITSKEYDVLELLVTNPGKVYSRAELLKLVWGNEHTSDEKPADERTVDVNIRRLREKIEVNASEPKYVQTKWGVGYFYKG